MLFLAGVSAGFSAWTKNEGLLFFASVIISLFGVGVLSRQQGSYLRQIGYFCLGAGPILLMIVSFKIQIAASNDLFYGQSLPTMINRLVDLSRHVTVLTVFQREIRNFSYWPFSLPVVLLFYLLVFGLTTEVQLQREILLLAMILTVMLSGYYFIYILTPNDVIWQLQYSLNRLLAQLWGSAVFAYFLGARTVEKVLSTRHIQISIQPLEGTVTR